VILQVKSEAGLHARPAALFVEKSCQFSSEVSVRNLTTDSDWVDAKSILSVLILGVEMDHRIELQADGEDEQQVIEAMEKLIDSGLG
jgi:phosphotransferase system HPr (HPr) family protein